MESNLMLMIPMLVIGVILIVIAMIDLFNRDKSEIRGGNKILWGAVILLLSGIGPVLYLTVGKKSI